jgi:rare lipoprotein A
MATGCASTSLTPTKTDSTGGEAQIYRESGKASYYAMKYQNRKTASGERLNQWSKTAAHKKLPFGTIVKVTNIKNGKSVVVKINDRGPFVKGRIIDLTRLAFSSIGDLDSGIINVEIEVVN